MDETREYGTWADWLGVPRHTFAAMFGATIARGADYRDTFQVFDPTFDLASARQARADAGSPEWFGEDDLYDDVRPTLSALRDAGFLVGIAGNQTVRAGGLLRGLELPSDFIATSDDWGVQKPDVEFFDHVIATVEEHLREAVDSAQIVYVGDRLDNDLRPAKQRGLRTVHIRRGPWGWIHGSDPDLPQVADWQITSLSELPELLTAERASAS